MCRVREGRSVVMDFWSELHWFCQRGLGGDRVGLAGGW